MSNADTITGTVARIERMGHTYYGNPIMRVAIELTHIDGIPAESSTPVILRISDNASLVYEIGNPEFKSEPHTFKLTKAGRISGRIHA